jgi:hypothetical protein
MTNTKMAVIWKAALCSPVDTASIIIMLTGLITPNDGSSKLLQNISQYLPHCMVQYLTRQPSSNQYVHCICTEETYQIQTRQWCLESAQEEEPR